MLEATTSCSLAGLCFCLLAISAVDLTSSTIFCCTFLPLLLFGCPLFARFLIPSQVKPVAVKRHRKRGRLKTDTTVAYECTRGSVKGAFANDTARDASASPFKLFTSVDLLPLLIAMGTVLVVAGVVVTALQLSSRAVVRIQDGNILPASVGGGISGGGRLGCCEGNRLGSQASGGDRLRSGGGDRLGSGGGGQLGCHSGGSGRLGSNYGGQPGYRDWGGRRLGSSGGDRLDSAWGDRLRCNDCDELRRGGGNDRSESNRLRSDGGGQLGCGDSGRLGKWSGDELGCNGSGGLGSASGGSASGGIYRLGSRGDDRLGCNGDDGLGCGDEGELSVGSQVRLKVDRLGYGVDNSDPENDGWIDSEGNRVAVRKSSGSALLARMIFDKDNPADRQAKGGREREGYMIPLAPC